MQHYANMFLKRQVILTLVLILISLAVNREDTTAAYDFEFKLWNVQGSSKIKMDSNINVKWIVFLRRLISC